MYRDIRLGVAVDVLLDGLVRRLVGLDVLCGDGAHRFLPFPACDVLEAPLSVDSALVFLERDDVEAVGGSTRRLDRRRSRPGQRGRSTSSSHRASMCSGRDPTPPACATS
jgi:hypothetical protein